MDENGTGTGQIACGRWKLAQEIGRSAHGVVYEAVGPCGERAAVKVCRRDAVGDECYEREFRGTNSSSRFRRRTGLPACGFS